MTAATIEAAPADETERKIASERADLLYSAVWPMAMTPFMALGETVLLWEDEPRWALVGWLALLAAQFVARLKLRHAYWRSDRRNPELWLARFTLGMLAVGVIWSLSGILVWIDDDPLCQTVVILASCAMVSSAVGIYSADIAAVDRFVWPIFAVLIGGVAWHGDRLHIGLAILGTIYVISLAVITRTANRTITRAIRTKDEKEALADRLATALVEVEASGRAKTSFLATMSHELRTPLNAIIGFSEMMHEQRHGPLGAGQYRDYARDIYHSGKHLLDLVNDILDLSKIEARRMELREELVDAGELVPICCRMLRQKAEQGGVTVETRVMPGLNPMRADRAKLRQILFNLVSNAIKFTPSGGSVVVSAGPHPSGGIVIAVADTGIGLSADEIPLALQPFRQIDNSLSRVHQGTGLGLPLAKALAELHDGTLEIVSTPDKGTVVTVAFPAERVVEIAMLGETARPPVS